MRRMFTLVMVVGIIIWGCQSESNEELMDSPETRGNTEAVEQPQEATEDVNAQETETNVNSNYEWNNLVQEYNQLWCKYSDDNTSADEKEKIYPRLKELQEELDNIYETVQDPQEKQALYQAMAKMVECK